MPEKGGNFLPPPSNAWMLRSSPLHQWRFGLLTALVFVGMVVVWSIDGCTIKNFLQSWQLKQDYITLKVNSLANNLNHTHPNPAHSLRNLTSTPTLKTTQFPIFSLNSSFVPANSSLETKNVTQFPSEGIANSDGNLTKFNDLSSLNWVTAELDQNFTANLLARWLAPGGEPCKDSQTVEIKIPGLDGKSLVELPAGEIHEFMFQAVDDSGNGRCSGGDYFEADLSGESWKSRPLVKDFGNGSYSVSFQVHPDFAGDYNLTVILLFRHFQGLKFSPARFAYDKQLRHIGIRFNRTKAQLTDLQICQKSDFSRDVWSGRWTRHGKNDACEISNDGRYRCLAPDFPCQNPWCNGSLGSLESNGWVYSSHCSFKLFSADPAWDCLKNRWIFFWGDSNHVDTIRNMLNFVLGWPEIKSVPRRFDMNFSNPKDPSQTVRITSIFNGHWNGTQNYLGLDSLKNEEFRNLLWKYFSEDRVPDTIIMNSGLHDGVHWSNLRAFTRGADYAVSFWKEVMESVNQRGLVVPEIIFRNTIATGGYARSLAFNPHKMEVFNGVFLEKMRQAGLVSGVIDNFDMTFPWHYDNRCNDGVHYGRAPLKMKWRDGEIGHQYFVDLMLCHVLLNVLCAR
ncbi:Immunoglobulin-like protein [Corchorus olitorius]|uniref:Immunoglobulin-like protein n=1 Tax=Corchorus olitorius TaxID=93759 RepID=A0A1R3IS14_9ROSI|nr:Immunoglobulin-like protein [Corchorus olitorius]